jgi:hypothetical protein
VLEFQRKYVNIEVDPLTSSAIEVVVAAPGLVPATLHAVPLENEETSSIIRESVPT